MHAMSLTRAELELTIAEASAACEGALIDRIHDAGEGAFVLEMRAGAARPKLLVSTRPSFSRAHLVEQSARTSEAPSAFVMLLRARLEGSRLLRCVLVGDDRVLRIEAARPGSGALIAELTGRHANAFWIEGVEDRIVASLRGNVSELRALLPGEPYRLPLSQATESGAGRVSPPRIGAEHPGLDAQRLYASLEAKAERDALRQLCERALRDAAKKIARREAAIAGDRARAEAAAGNERLGSLLLANLQAAKRGASSVRVMDWTVDPPIEIEIALDPALSPKANAERYFARYRKYKEGLSRIETQETRARQDRAAVDEWCARATTAETIDALRLLRDELTAKGILRRTPAAAPRPTRKASEAPTPLPYRRFVSRDGRPILVGKGAGENDRLTFKVARGNDLWLHARDYPGAHVVVPMGRDEDPLPETLLDAATLAAHYSQAKGAAVVDVGYARRKLVHKPKGAPPGVVAVSDERTLAVRMEPARLERLKRTRG
jgi:predicted ribosome quality control (RQC) complex YloA/Tae2 family protein